MMPRILIIDPYYPAFLKSFYNLHPHLKTAKFSVQKKELMNEMFGTADFYSHALTALGCQTEDVVMNNEYFQKRWLSEHSSMQMSLPQKVSDFLIGHFPIISGKIAQGWELKILHEQIKSFRPDVIYSHNLGYVDPNFLNQIKDRVKLIVGQIACPVPLWRNFAPYDLIITSFPHYVPMFKRKSIKSEYLQLCFEPRVLRTIPAQKRIYDVTFIGGISRAHKQGFKLLNDLANRIKIDVWGYGKEELDPKSNLYKYHHGEAWGKDMYKLMLQSKITINRHIDVAKNYANNMRLYEATGCGVLLITDHKDNLNQLFKEGKEVVSYTSQDDLVNKIWYYLTHDDQRMKIAAAGQTRTLRDHTYGVRMKQLLNIIQKYL